MILVQSNDNIINMKESGKYTQNELLHKAKEILIELKKNIGICNCGKSYKIMFMIRDVLQVINDKAEKIYMEKSPYSLERAQSEYEDELSKVIEVEVLQEFVLHILNYNGLIYHDKNINYNYLSPYGEEILCALRIIGNRHI